MQKIRVEDALGYVLVHDITQIVPGQIKDARFRKGHIVIIEEDNGSTQSARLLH